MNKLSIKEKSKTPVEPLNKPVGATALSIAVAFAILTLFAPAVFATEVAGTLSAPTSNGGVTPYIIDGENPGGNRTCAEVGTAFFDDADYYEFSSGRIDHNGAFDQNFPEGLNVTTDGTYVSWSSTFSIGTVIVKGSNEANIYVYDPQAMSDSGLAAPLNPSGNPAGLSNITFCWNPETVVEETQWCSPGYWRQSHHLDSWEATGISPSEDYLDHFPSITLSRQGQRQNASTDPTLWEVLQSPQWYGGDAFNDVGDLLSHHHPDVNFSFGDMRIEDSCPL